MNKRLIRCYGLFWKWDDVHRGGGPGQRGMLLGHRKGEKREDPVDFADQRGIYVLYGNYALVYVGQTARQQGLLKRLTEHTKDHLSGRWDRFSWFGTRRVLKWGDLSALRDAAHPTIDVVLDQFEAVLIHAAEPPLNRSGGRWGSGVEQYFQVRDDRLGPDPQEMIRELYDQRAT